MRCYSDPVNKGFQPRSRPLAAAAETAPGPRQGQSCAQICPDAEEHTPPPRIGFDPLDGLGLTLLPGGIDKAILESSKELATNIHADGGAGGTILRMLSREVALRRARTRYYTGLMDIHAKRATGDPHQARLVRLYVTIAENERRAMTTAVDLLARLGGGNRAISIIANNAAVCFEARR